MDKDKSNSGCARAFMAIVCIVLGLVLTGMIAGTVYANYLLSLMNRPGDTMEETLSQEQIQDILKEETLGADETTAPVVEEDDVDWGEDQGSMIETSGNIVNILLIGQDSRSTEGRS